MKTALFLILTLVLAVGCASAPPLGQGESSLEQHHSLLWEGAAARVR